MKPLKTKTNTKFLTWVLDQVIAFGFFTVRLEAPVQLQASETHQSLVQKAHAEDPKTPEQLAQEKAEAEAAAKKAAEEAAAKKAKDDAAKTQTPASNNGGIISGAGSMVGGVVSTLATLIIKLLSGIIWFVLYWMGDLMDNTFILEGDIGEKIRSVWVIVRNFVNIFFALALVVLAFVSIIGYGDESGNYGMKKFIPKMALAMIAVNFTFFACRIVLDVNNVLTTAVFAIPQNVTNLTDIAATSGGTKIFKKFTCLDSKNNINQLTADAEKLSKDFKDVINQLGGVCFAQKPEGTPETGANGTKIFPNGQQIISLGTGTFTKKDFVWAMATQFQGLHNLNRVSQLLDPSFTSLSVNALFSIIFAVIYGAAYLAMFVVLMERMVVLWICIMLSPLMALSIAMSDILPEKLSSLQKTFIDHAFIPLKMAIPISFGYILVSQMTLSLQTSSNVVMDKALDLSSSGEFARDISITSLMYGAASIAIIWMGVFMSTESVDSLGLVGKIKDLVQSAGSTVAKWPTYLPIVPMSGGMASISTFKTMVSEAHHAIVEAQRERDQRITEDNLSKMGIVQSEVMKAVREIQRMRETGKIDRAKFESAMRTIAPHRQQFDKTIGEIRTGGWDSESQRQIAEVFTDNSDWAHFMKESGTAQKVIELQDKIKSGTVGKGSREEPKYGDFDHQFKGTSLSIDGSKFTEDKVKAMRIEQGKTNNPLELSAKGMKKFTEWVSTGSPEERAELLSKANLQKLIDKVKTDELKGFRGEVKKDKTFKDTLLQSFTGDKDADQKLFELYVTLFGARDENGKIMQDEVIKLRDDLIKTKGHKTLEGYEYKL